MIKLLCLLAVLAFSGCALPVVDGVPIRDIASNPGEYHMKNATISGEYIPHFSLRTPIACEYGLTGALRDAEGYYVRVCTGREFTIGSYYRASGTVKIRKGEPVLFE